jgi:predicted O-methyltransferase YrrM
MVYDKNLINKVKGFLDEEEGQHLYDISLTASRMGPCLEIGSYCGKSAVYLGSACQENNSILYSIDHHTGSEEQQPGEEYFDPELYDIRLARVNTIGFFRQTLEKAGLEDTVVPIISKSKTAARKWTTPLSLVFIDGGHAFETVNTDYNCWAGHVLPEGFLLIHDIFKDPSEGGQAPYQVYQIAVRSGLFREFPMVKTLGVLQRLKGNEVPEGY